MKIEIEVPDDTHGKPLASPAIEVESHRGVEQRGSSAGS